MKVSLLIALTFFASATYSQGVFSNNTNSALQKVIEDYPNKFRNIQGDKISGEQQRIDYRSKIEVQGSSSSIISHYSSARTELFSWKTDIFESASFEQSRDRFKEVFNNIKNTIVKIEGMPAFILSGKYDYPLEEKKTTTISFQLLPANAEMQKLKVDLSMLREGTAWKVVLMVYEKEKNDEVVSY